MQREPRTAGWLPFVTFLAGVVLTSSVAVLLGSARGQASAPPDPRLRGEAVAPDPEDDPLLGPASVGNDRGDKLEGVGIEALYKSVIQWNDKEVDIPEAAGSLPPIEELLWDRYEITGKFLQIATTQFNDPPRSGHPHDIGARLAPVLELSRERLELRLGLSETREEHVQILIRELAYAKAVLENLETLARGRTATILPRDLWAPRLYRLELETRLAELAEE